MDRSTPRSDARDREGPYVTAANAPDGAARYGCAALGNTVAALVAGQMQMVSELASLRYEMTLLAGGTPRQAVAYAVAGLKRQRFLLELDVEGFDPDDFYRRLRSVLEERGRSTNDPGSLA